MVRRAYNSERVGFLASEILRHKELYYAGKPEVSDAVYDALEDELKTLAPDHPVLNIVGSNSSSSTNAKVIHDVPMLSLNKTYSVDDLLGWMGSHEVVGTLKVDGTSISLVYREGRFQLGKTRGNGREGEDVTTKLRWVSDVVPTLAESVNAEIRGELYCTETRFIKLAEEMERRGLERPTSPRNIVAGVLGRKTHADLAHHFNFFAFDVLGMSGFKTEIEKSKWLEQQGFRLPHVRLLKSGKDVEDYLIYVKGVLNEGEIGCDGAVFSYNQLSLHEELGVTSHHPRFKNSFKWQGETAQSKITRIDWATSRLGIVTPVAVIEPVMLSGATITNITLHNAAHVRTYNLKPGDVIELVRSGEVIPKFLSVVREGGGALVLPTRCPSCSAQLVADDVRLKCPAANSCPAQQMGSVLNWIRSAEIDDISEKRLQSMMDAGFVKNIPDLYRLTVPQLLTLPATKEKMAEKLHSHIQGTRNLTLPRFLNGLGIEGTGFATWEKVVEHYGTLYRICSLTVSDLVELDGFAEKSAAQMVDGLKRCRGLIDELLNVGVKPQESTGVKKTSDRLSGMQIVITGALSRPRKEVEELIKAAGGKIGSSVTKNTAVLVTNETDSTSSKMEKARLLEIPVWSEEELVKNLL